MLFFTLNPENSAFFLKNLFAPAPQRLKIKFRLPPLLKKMPVAPLMIALDWVSYFLALLKH